MKVSYNWLNTFFDNRLPPVATVVDKLTFHAWEVDEFTNVGDDTVLDIKVLPDRSAFALSHRGIAKDLGVILNLPLTRDPLKEGDNQLTTSSELEVKILHNNCVRYQAALIKNVKVGPSPSWLKSRLEVLGQKSINNIVDATNYVMFDLGQPLHAFDADKLKVKDGKKVINIRLAKTDEAITTLTGENYKLSADELLIVDGVSDEALAIAGIKGGKLAEVDNATTNIILESASFNPITTRRSSSRLKLRTDASVRYENGLLPEMTKFGLLEAIKLIVEIAGGNIEGYSESAFSDKEILPVSVSLQKASSVLGVTLDVEVVKNIMERFGYDYSLNDVTLTVKPPFERNDLNIAEDVIEELGRIYGYEHVVAAVPTPITLTEINKRFYYSEVVRDVLLSGGFSEVYTSSFHHKDGVKLLNALASDKGYLRSNLTHNIAEALKKNVANKDLLGLSFVGLFEIGTVFQSTGETYALSFGVRRGMDYKPKADQSIIDNAKTQIEKTLGVNILWQEKEGIVECDFAYLLNNLPDPVSYQAYDKSPIYTYTNFSTYPAISRDIALFVNEGVSDASVEEVLKVKSGELCVRLSKFDEFTKDGRTSFAFRLVFQSYEKTLTDEEVNVIMNDIYQAVSERDWEVR